MNTEHGLLFELVKKDFLQCVNQMVNEIDVSFDYISDATKQSLQSYVSRLNTDDALVHAQLADLYSTLEPYRAQLSLVCEGKHKVKKGDLVFMDSITLFENQLAMKQFAHENRNTKIVLIKYMYTMFMTGMFVHAHDNNSIEGLLENMSAFLENVQNKHDRATANAEASTSKQGAKKRHTSSRKNPMDEINGLVGQLLENPEMASIANDISKELMDKKVDPKRLLTSLMSGKPDRQLTGLVESISTKLDAKMQSGEIDKEALESQAQDILGAVSSSDIVSQLPGLVQQFMQNPTSHTKK